MNDRVAWIYPGRVHMSITHLVTGLLAMLALAACGLSSQEGEDSAALPNSLSDTSAHVAKREIPSYGPPRGGAADSLRRARARGQVLYVPVYSHIFQRSEDREFALAATLSIRNPNPSASIQIREVDYFDSEGTLLRSYLDGRRKLGPLASTYVVIEEGDRSGGVGANFIVEWGASDPVVPLVVETVMISTANTQGISFTSSARVLQEW